MVMLRAFAALLAGFATMAALIAAAAALAAKVAPRWRGEGGRLSTGYAGFNVVYSFAAAMAGGWVTCWIALNNPLMQALVLAIVVLLLSALSALQQRGMQPIWYQLLLTAVAPAGVLAGALLQLRVAGIL